MTVQAFGFHWNSQVEVRSSIHLAKNEILDFQQSIKYLTIPSYKAMTSVIRIGFKESGKFSDT